MIYAVYRCLYGEDFIQQSIKSIDPYVDKIFIFYDDIPWANATECKYKGKIVKFPDKFDNILEKIMELNNQKIILLYDHQYDNINQFTHFVNDRILPIYARPDTIMIIEVDHVFRKDQIEGAIKEFDSKGFMYASTSQIFLWKTFDYKLVYPMKRRASVVFWNMKSIDKMPPTARQGEFHGQKMNYLESYVHNLGYCMSKEVMYWKHLTAIGFSQKIGDSPPNEKWFDDKWVNWDFEKNNSNLEIAKGYEHWIPRAELYDKNGLPEILKGE